MNQIVKSLTQADLYRLKIPMAVVYKKPKDFKTKYVARIWEGADNTPTDTITVRNSIAGIRKDIVAAGFTICYNRSGEDDPCIMETWIK